MGKREGAIGNGNQKFSLQGPSFPFICFFIHTCLKMVFFLKKSILFKRNNKWFDFWMSQQVRTLATARPHISIWQIIPPPSSYRTLSELDRGGEGWNDFLRIGKKWRKEFFILFDTFHSKIIYFIWKPFSQIQRESPKKNFAAPCHLI